MLNLTLSPNPIRTHDRAPNPNRPTIDICHGIDNFSNNIGSECGGVSETVQFSRGHTIFY